MEWSDVRIFLVAVRTGSYTAAAQRLGVNRTTVGRRIVALEQAVGRALFMETPGGPEPTADGRLLLAAAARIEGELDGFRRATGICGAARESVRVASSIGIASEFLPEFAAFRRREPDAFLELVGALDPLEAVSQRRADLALALVRLPPRRLTGVQVAPVSQADYALRGAAPGPRLGWGREVETAIPGQWTVANPIGDDGGAAGAMRFNSWPQLKAAVLAGLGRASLWCFAADAEPTLERLTEPDPRHDSALWLLHRSETPPSPALRGLIAFLEPTLRTRLAGP